jgi:hypothetical protein
MIFIIGIKHDLHQTGPFGDKQPLADFEELLGKVTKEEKIQLIAEEFSQDAARFWNIEKTPTQTFAEKLGVDYIHVDPGIKERKTLGIKSREETASELGIDIFNLAPGDLDKINANSKSYDHLREEEWLRRLTPHAGRQVVFVCGFEHTQSFFNLLIAKGYKATVYKILS